MNRARPLVLLALLCLAAAAAPAQPWRGPASLALEVKGKPMGAVEGAMVILRYQQMEPPGGPRPVLTNAAGKAAVHDLAEGIWEVEVSHEAFLSLVATVVLQAGKKPVVQASFLQASGSSLTPIRVKFQDGRGKSASESVPLPPEAEARLARRRPPTPPPPPAPPAAPEPGRTTRVARPPEPVMPEPELRPLPEGARTAETPAAPAAPATEQSPPPTAPPTEPAAPETAAPPPAPEPPAPAPPPAPEPPAPAPPPAPEPTAPTPPPAAEPTAPAPQAPPQPAIPEPAPDPVMPEPPEPQPVPAPEVPEPATTPPTGEPVTPEPAAPQPAPEPVEPEPTMPEPAPPPPTPVPEPTVPEPAVPSPPPAAPAPKPAPAPAEPADREPAAAVPPAATAPEPATAETEPPAAPVPPATAPPAAPAAILPAPGPLGPTLRAYRDRNCVECRPGEFAISVESVVGPASRPCDGPSEADGRELASLLGSSIALELNEVAAPAAQAVTQMASAEPGARAAELLGDDSSACRIVAAVIPKAGRFRGVRMEAADASGVGDCQADRPCPVGRARWIGQPRVAREPSANVIWGLFVNEAPDRARRARLTVYFAAPYRAWDPPR